MTRSSSRLVPKPYPGLLSLVVPMYNEDDILPLLRARLTEVMDQLGCASEVVAVDDGSSDSTMQTLVRWTEADPRVRVISLARNFGHQLAATAGLDHARGEAVVLMDADLQDPPELIHPMIEQYCAGYDVVVARRVERQGEGMLKRATAWVFYRAMRSLVHPDLPVDVGDFRLISRRCLDAIRAMRETHRFLRGMVAWVGFPQTAVEFRRPQRAAGQTKYSWRRMLRFAWIGIVSFSPAPLRLSFALAMLVAFAGLLAAAWAMFSMLAGIYVVPGWTSQIVLTSLIGSSILIALGVVGEYVAKIYEEIKGRPLYVIADTVNLPAERDEHEEDGPGGRRDRVSSRIRSTGPAPWDRRVP
jgi:glycosyltransferase involved in cell wall biosynthesis